MKKKKTIAVTLLMLLLVILSGTVYGNAQLTVKRERAVMRDGAGSFYNIVAELPVGAVVSKTGEEDDWYEVRYNNNSGFTSSRVFEKTAPRESVLSGLTFQESGTSVSRHAMSAGVKGFGERFTKTFKGDPSFIEMAFTYQMDARRYQAFFKETYRGVNKRNIRRRVTIPKANVPDYYTVAEEGFGLGVAASIASLGLYRNEALHEYVNQVGNVVVEASDVYDKTFKFFILDIENPNAYATPGGIIFITKGMLKAIDNEAELAIVLGHEIGHVARFHGVIELNRREHQIAAADAFASMDSYLEEFNPKSMTPEKKELIEDMEELSFSIFETLIQGRLDEYEEEADLLGMIYAIRAGYLPQGMISLLERLISSGSLSNNEHYTPDINKIRITKMTKNLRSMSVPKGLNNHRERYQKMKRNLR